MNDAPKLLVEWSSRREEFLSAIRPAFGRSPQKLAGEAQTGLFPYWGILVSWAFELLLLVAAIVLPGKLASLQCAGHSGASWAREIHYLLECYQQPWHSL